MHTTEAKNDKRESVCVKGGWYHSGVCKSVTMNGSDPMDESWSHVYTITRGTSMGTRNRASWCGIKESPIIAFTTIPANTIWRTARSDPMPVCDKDYHKTNSRVILLHGPYSSKPQMPRSPSQPKDHIVTGSLPRDGCNVGADHEAPDCPRLDYTSGYSTPSKSAHLPTGETVKKKAGKAAWATLPSNCHSTMNPLLPLHQPPSRHQEEIWPYFEPGDLDAYHKRKMI